MAMCTIVREDTPLKYQVRRVDSMTSIDNIDDELDAQALQRFLQKQLRAQNTVGRKL